MNNDLKEEYNDSIEEQFGYRPSDLIWFLATQIAYQHIRMLTAKKLGKDIEAMERMINHHSTLISRNIEHDFIMERARKYGTGN